MNLEPDSFEDQRGQFEVMDFMDIDQVVEVPDTPERLIAACNNDENTPGNHSDGSSSCRVITKQSINENPRNEPREKGKSVNFHSNRRLFVRPDNHIHSNSSGIMLENSSTSKNLLTTLDNAHHEKGKSLYNSNVQRSNFQENSSFVDLTEQNGCGHSSRKDINGFSEVDALDTSSKSSGLNNTDKFGQRFDHGKGVIRQKKLVRNGYISPHNLAKSKEVTEKKHDNVDIMDLTTESKASHGFKGKGVSFHSSFCEDTNAKNRHLSQRTSLISKEQSNNLSQEASKSSKDSNGWITTRNPLTKVNLPLPDGKAASSSTINQSINTVGCDVEVPRVNDSGEPLTSRSNRKNKNKNKNKNSRGGGSLDLDPVIEIDEVSTDENRGPRLDNEGPGVRALQVEADEMLARELQEQLYNEELAIASAFGAHEATAIQQEHSSHAIHAAGRPAYRPASRGGSSVSNMYQNTRSNSSRNPSASSQRGVHGQSQNQNQSQTSTSTRLTRIRGRFPGRPRTLSSPGNSIFPPNMDLDMRMQILEALEAINDIDLPMPNDLFQSGREFNDLLHVGREFNENDYEMLLALDDNNHQHGGATHAQISNLPQSTVQVENLQECAVCLEKPTIGETIRHLPCLHGFHKDCIDEWLRRKTSCPICKSSVT
ncbi:unnamed protein product [Lactuca virosa]|uniref:RING-type domain-containing protein n=1 Tax=Lactuca virosa TaxID=75947 RepID=A0AAU9NEM7_9ASTR|nr:unnamed protein product [Lactuca virosa]